MDLIPQFKSFGLQLYEKGVSTYQADPDYWNIFGIVTLFAILIITFIHQMKEKPLRRSKRDKGKEMEGNDRVKQMLSDAITECLENAVHEERISRKQANYWYSKLARSKGLSDLKHRKVKLGKGRIEFLKEQIRKRIASNRELKVNLPADPAPEPKKKSRLLFIRH